MSNLSAPPIKTILFIIWFAILSGLGIITSMLGSGEPFGDGTFEALHIALLVPAVISTLLRWFIIPRITSLEAMLVPMIIGLALAEATAILGIILLTDGWGGLVILGAIAVLQYFPPFLPGWKPRQF